MLPEPTATDRILVVAPHPDDEVLCCAGLLQRAVERGSQVAIVWITAGDGSRLRAWVARVSPSSSSGRMLRLGGRRIGEAGAAADMLGIPGEHRYFLGYPDRGVDLLLGPDPERPLRSRYTRSSTIPYAAALSTGALLTGVQLEQDLARVIADFRPTWVIAPAAADRHPDHSGSGILTARMLKESGSPAVLTCYLVHGGRHWPAPRGLKPELPLNPSRRAQDLDWSSFELTPAERQLKEESLRTHRSQMRVMPRFLNAFVRSNELFAACASGDVWSPAARDQNVASGLLQHPLRNAAKKGPERSAPAM